MSGTTPSPLARLVLFMVCLSIVGSVIAGLHYAAIDRPLQEIQSHPPANEDEDCDWITTQDASECYAKNAWRWLLGYHLVWTLPKSQMCCWAYN